MIRTILQRLGLLPGLLLLLVLGAAHPAQASHLLGGEMTYRYLDANGPTAAPLRYEITLQVYNNSSTTITPLPAAPVNTVIIPIYQSNGTKLTMTATNFPSNGTSNGNGYSNSISNGNISIAYTNSVYYPAVPVPVGCTVTGATQQPYTLRVFTAIVNLPATTTGYYAFWTLSARNNTISNLSNPGSAALTLYTTMAPPVYANHSPIFANQAIAVICVNDTTTLLNNAVDADGDQLVYTFGTPYSVTTTPGPTTFTGNPTTVTYLNSTYSATTPLGASPNYANINSNTGIAKYYATSVGSQYVVAVDVKEYRNVNGTPVLIGTTRRDVQLVVGICPPTPAPALPTASSSGGGGGASHNYTVEAGSSISIPLSSSQADLHDLDMTVSSVLLDGAGGYDATFGGSAGTVPAGSPVGSVTISGTGGNVSGTFVYNPSCGDARATPYDITIVVTDKGCGGKTVADVIHITVVKPTGVSAIAGDAAVCGLNNIRTYTATVGTAPNVSWRLSGGGSFVSANPGNPVQVLWTTAGTYTLTARGVSQYGCLTDSVTKTVVVSPAAVLTVTGNQSICAGSSTTITITGAAPYTVTDGVTTLTGNGPFTLSPAQATVYTVSGTPTGVGCVPTTQFTINVNPLPAAATGPAVSTCSGVPVTIGSGPIPGSTYSWSPSTGLSSSTVANPTVTLTTTSSTINQTYTLTETGGNGCVATRSVVVTVYPLPVAVPGAAVAICSGNSAQLGAAPVAGNTYVWTPTTGLSNPTAANPTVTLTNTTSAPVTTTYTLTITSANGCVSVGTVNVTVNPRPAVVPGAAVSFCSGGSAQLGATPVAGYTYSWSPTTGLSSSTVANPTVTLTNTTSSPVTITYTLTVTNGTTGCTSTGTVAVTVNPNPVAAPGAAVSFCSGSTAQLGATPVTGYTYSWSPTTGLSNPSIANPTITLTNTSGAPITTTYTLTVTNGTTNCVSTGTVAVTIKTAPPVTPGANVVICSTETAQLGATPVAGNTYSWSPTTGLSNPTSANPTVTLSNTTASPIIVTYTLTVTNTATTCTSTGTVDVKVNPVPVPVLGPNQTICSGNTAQLGAAPLPGYTYVWTPTTGLSNPNIANPTVTLTNTTGAATSITYTMRVTSAPITCTSTGTVTITVNPNPVVVPGAAVAICSGNSAQLGGAPVAGYTYSWSPTTGLSNPSIANPTVTLTNTTGAAVTTTYTLTVTNTATTCFSTGTVAVTTNFNPIAQPGAAVAICSGNSAQLGAAPVTGYTYSWSPATGLSSTTTANPTVTLTNTTASPSTTTYTLKVTNTATGCFSTGTVAVTTNPNPLAVPGNNVTICSGNTAQLGAAPVTGLAYSWSPATGLNNPSIANPTVTLTNTGTAATTTTYTLTVTNSATGCTNINPNTVVVTTNPNPVAVPGANVVICSGETDQLGAAPVAGLTYSWSPTTGLSSATIANPTVTLTNAAVSPIVQTYTLTVTNPATSCFSTATVDVKVNPTPVPMPGANINTCSGVAGQLGAAPLPGYTYVWTPTTGLSNPNIANPTVTLTNTTGGPISQTYTLTLTSAPITCTNHGTVTVTVYPLPAVAPGAAVTFCSGGIGQLGAAPVAGLTYSWSPATGLSSTTAANPTVTLTNPGTTAIVQTYTLTVTNTATGCQNTGTVAVNVNPLPTVVPGAAIAICSGTTGQLGGTPVAGYAYSWSPATGLSSTTAANPTVTLTNTTSAATVQTYTLTVTNTATTCVNTSTVDVTVSPNPIAQPGAAITTCSGDAGQLGATPVAGYTYSWSPTTGLSSATAANPTVTLTNATTAATVQTYTLTVTNSATSCFSTGTVAVTVNPLPAVAPGAAITICSGNTGQLGAAPVVGLTYSWSPTTGLSSATVANPTVVLTNTTTAATVQTYTLTVTNTATTCHNAATVAVTVNPAIIPGTIGADQSVCPLFAASPLLELGPAGGGVGTYTYQWESSPDGITWTAIPTATGTTYSPGLLTATTYYRRRASSGDCASAVSNVVKLTIMPVLAAGVTLPTPAAQCAGTPMTFTPVPINAGPAPTYRWFVNGTLVATTGTYTSSTLADGDQVTVELTVTPGFCAIGTPTAIAPVHLIQIPPPAVTIVATSPLPGCSGEPINFKIATATNPGATPGYQWQVDGQNVAGATAPTFSPTNLHTGQVVAVVLIASTTCGPLPVTSAGITVTVNPAIVVNAGPDKLIMEGDQVQLEGSANGTYPVTWTPAQSLTFSNGDQLHPYAAPTVTTVYTLSATVVNCTGQSTVTVTVTPKLRIPSAFSPNGDGNDDTWEIDNVEGYTNNHVTIFNRWGNKLFETTNYGRGNEWNGTISGSPAPIGTYYYIITLPNGHSYTGPLTIIY